LKGSIARHFAAVVKSGIVGNEKPHPRMFETARTHSHLGRPVWMIGDNLTSDCLSVAPFDVKAILVRTRADPAYEREGEDLYSVFRFITAC
jgi:FMN phosphatase YigB (HAD superfamily)